MAIRQPILILAILLLLLIGSWLFRGFGMAEEEYRYRLIEIKTGDTLWGLARKHGEPEGDLRETVDVIQEVNGLEDSRLLPGQLLKVPIAAGKE